MKFKILLLFISPLFFLVGEAQEGHSHAHDEEVAQSGTVAPGIFTVYAESQRYELTLKHEEIKPGSVADLTLYVADYVTNIPLSNVELKLSVQEDPAIVVEAESIEPGVYHLHGNFPAAQPYSLAVSINSPDRGADLLLLKSVEVGKAPPSDEAANTPHTHANWWKFALVFLGGLGIGYLFLRRRPKVATSILLIVILHAVIQDIAAHGGHDEKKGSAGNQVLIPKETQFLFEILTNRVSVGNFQPAVEFFGTVAPSPGGFANIVAPQSGKVTSLKVTPGQRVNAGQVLAEMLPSTSLSEKVGVAAETGRLQAELKTAQAELRAAERELNRLQAISDIVAKKELQAAEARYNAAKANYDALRSVTAGAAISSSGSVVFKAPVTGVIGQFILAPGAEVIAGTTLFSITNLDKVFIEAQVYDRDMDIVKDAGKYQAVCTDDDFKTAEVKIVSAALEVNPTNQSQKVLFEVLNPVCEFKLGEFVTLQAFRQVTDKTIFVPNSSLSEINGKPVIFVKLNPEMYEVRYVTLGEDNGSHTVVLEGLTEGERFVTGGTYQVKMMMLNQ